ncbi:MAG: CHRD domain-containing protein [Actinobacteria bacterium]|nr:CHRD domain-containing protein [Actinomycetota bacterium]
MKRTLIGMLALVGAVALAAASTAGGTATQKGKGKPSKSATPVFKLHLKPSQEVPRIQGLRASAVGHVTFDLTRNEAGAITSGEVIFYFNYSFPGTVTISGLHIHQGAKGTNGGIVVDSGTSEPADADGQGNLTKVVSGSPATLQAILDNPRNYYVNLHTTVPDHTGGAVRAQMHNPKKR